MPPDEVVPLEYLIPEELRYRMLAGSFANPDTNFLAIWKSRELYQQASPLIETLADLGPDRALPIMNDAGDANEWRFTLARIGVAIEELPVLPTQSPQSVERNARKVANKLQRYNQDKASQEEI
ncbi:hypothetical protein SH139x_002283 [Planctomycetaceae bacterium SH139]